MGDTFALDCICLVLIQDWLNMRIIDIIYSKKTERSGTGAGVPPTAEH